MPNHYAVERKALERLIALDGAPVWAAITRAKDQRGAAIVRHGTLYADPARDAAAPVAQIVDDDELPIVTIRPSDKMSVWSDLASVEFRASFRVDILQRPFPASVGDTTDMTYERAARELAAELEAGFRNGLLFRPDPDAEAGPPQRYGVPKVETKPLSDNSFRFAIGHSAATLHPVDAGIKLTCIASDVRYNLQVTEVYHPKRGEYALDPAGIEALGSDIRAFLSHKRDRFVLYEPERYIPEF